MGIHRVDASLDNAQQDRLTSGLAFARAARERVAGALLPVTKIARAARVLLFPSLVRRLHGMGFLRQFVDRDPCFFLSSEHYLSRYFSVWDRIHNALLHYEHESRTFDAAYRASVYGGKNGILLWKQVMDAIEYSIRLVVSEGNGFEGDLSVILDVDAQEACRMSYTVVDGATFGLAAGPTLFVTRNQVKRGRELDLFRLCYRHNSPQYFCLAAIAGIAAANGFNCITAIRGRAQGSYKPQFEEQFKNSYCKFWQQFGAKVIDRQAWLLQIPLNPPPISSVTTKHRARANDRRARWADITRQAMSAVSPHRVHRPVARELRVWFHPMLCIASQTFCDYTLIV